LRLGQYVKEEHHEVLGEMPTRYGEKITRLAKKWSGFQFHFRLGQQKCMNAVAQFLTR